MVFFKGVGGSYHIVIIYSDVLKEHSTSVFRVTEHGPSGCWSIWRKECVGYAVGCREFWPTEL